MVQEQFGTIKNMNIKYDVTPVVKSINEAPRYLQFPVLLGYRQRNSEDYHVIVWATSSARGIALKKEGEITGKVEDWSFGDTYQSNVVNFIDPIGIDIRYIWEILPKNHKIELSN